MNWFQRFMAGRYGGDQLSLALLILSLILTFMANLSGVALLGFVGYIPLGFALFRILSRNITKRRMENYKFAMLMGPVYSWFIKTMRRLRDTKTHRYFKCPDCKAQLRVPKGKGKILITCPKCKKEFQKKT